MAREPKVLDVGDGEIEAPAFDPGDLVPAEDASPEDRAIIAEVNRRATEAVQRAFAGLQEAEAVGDFKEFLHPRGRGGEWVRKPGAGIARAVERATPEEPQVLPWHEPPQPVGHAGERKGGGLTAIGVTNTKLGDEVEHVLAQAMGFKDAHPGRRQGPFDLQMGENVYEVKAVSRSASEYKAKPKKAEVERKLAHAKENGLKPHIMIVVYDPEQKQIHAYVKDGVGAYRLTNPKAGWSYIGAVPLDLGDTWDPAALQEWLEEAKWEEWLHPRGRGGEWIRNPANHVPKYGFRVESIGKVDQGDGYMGERHMVYDPETGQHMAHIDILSKGGHAVIDDLMVDERFQHRGVATKLLDYARHADPEMSFQHDVEAHRTDEGKAWIKSLPPELQGTIPPVARPPAKPAQPDTGLHWHTSNKGSDSKAIGRVPVRINPSGYDKHQPGPGREGWLRKKTDEEMQGYGDALRDEVDRHPEVFEGPMGVRSIRWRSTLSGEQAWAWALNRAAAATGHDSRGQFILLDDLSSIDGMLSSDNVTPAENSARGVMTHELGHAFAGVHGVNNDNTRDMRGLLGRYGFTPQRMHDVSRYAEADPREAFAEMYAQEFTPGFQIKDVETRRRFLKLIADMRANTSGSVSHLAPGHAHE